MTLQEALERELKGTELWNPRRRPKYKEKNYNEFIRRAPQEIPQLTLEQISHLILEQYKLK